jgi:hypothetical protein
VVFVCPRRWSPSHSIPSRGIFAIILILVSVFVRPGWGTRSGGGVGCSVGVDMVSGFVCAIVVMVSNAKCGGMWWSSRCYIALFRFRWWPWLCSAVVGGAAVGSAAVPVAALL